MNWLEEKENLENAIKNKESYESIGNIIDNIEILIGLVNRATIISIQGPLAQLVRAADS